MTDKFDYLDEGQKTRVAALAAARASLVTTTGLASSRPPEVVDLISVAEWIVTGEDPWAPAAVKPEKTQGWSDASEFKSPDVPLTASIEEGDPSDTKARFPLDDDDDEDDLTAYVPEPKDQGDPDNDAPSFDEDDTLAPRPER